MRRLAAHYGRFRHHYPDDRLLIVFDIDGTILDMRHMVRHVLVAFDRAHGSTWFEGLHAEDICIHENQVEDWLAERALPAPVREQAHRWYLEQRWQPESVVVAHRPHQGVLDVIRWFQIQPATAVGLNTGRPEELRDETVRSLNALGREYRVEFGSDLLQMNPCGYEQGVAAAKVAGLAAFRDAGFRVFAVVDDEHSDISAMAAADGAAEILFLHAETFYKSTRTPTPRTVRGRSYDLSALVSERDVPQHVQLVWHGVNDEWNLRQFLASPVQWGECDVRLDPLGRLVLRHDSFDETPWSPGEALIAVEDVLEACAAKGRGVKFDLKQPDVEVLDAVLEIVRPLIEEGRLDARRLWFNGTIETLGQAGFARLAAEHPGAVIQCPVDFLAPLVVSAPQCAQDVLAMLAGWGVSRFSISWAGPHTRLLFERLERWGHDVNIYAVPDLEAFLQAALLLPRSLTADFNFPQWHYFGRGSGENRDYHRYGLVPSGALTTDVA